MAGVTMRPRATALWLLIHSAAALAPDTTRSPVKCRDARLLDAWAIAGVAAQSFYDDPAPVVRLQWAATPAMAQASRRRASLHVTGDRVFVESAAAELSSHSAGSILMDPARAAAICCLRSAIVHSNVSFLLIRCARNCNHSNSRQQCKNAIHFGASGSKTLASFARGWCRIN